MELHRRRNVQDDRTSNCWSFGSNYDPCSQSRKISIGVMVDESEKMGSRDREGNNAVLPNKEILASSGGKFTDDKKNKSGMIAVVKGKQPKVPEQVSPWISTRSLHQETPTAKTVQNHANQTSVLQTTNGMQKKFDGAAGRLTTVQFYANQTSFLRSIDGVGKRIDSVTYGRTRGKEGTTERVEEFAFASAQEVRVLDEGAGEEKTDKIENRSNEALKTKLWEILGDATSPNEQNSKSQVQTLEVGVENLKPVGHLGQKDNKVVKPKQNSDTIETDSESDETVRRPVTRSLSRKKAPTTAKKAPTTAQLNLQHKDNNRGNLLPSSSNRRKPLEENIFSFKEAEGWSRSLPGTLNGGSSIPRRKKNERKNSGIEPRRIYFPEKDTPDKGLRATDMEKTLPPVEKTMSHSNKMEGSRDFPPQDNRSYLQQKNVIPEDHFQFSCVRKKTDQQGNFDSPPLPRNAEPQEDFHCPSLKKNDPQEGFHTSAFGMKKTPCEESSPSQPSPTGKPIKQDVHCPEPAERKFVVEGFCSPKTLRASKPGSFGLDVRAESSDDTRELNKSPIRESSPVMEENDAEISLAQSSSEEQEVESLEEDLPNNKDCRATETWSPETDTPEKPPFMHHPSKRLRNQEGIKICESRPTSPSPKGTKESNGFQRPSDQNYEDGLERTVALFAQSLERFKTKVKSQTNKKSSEVLASVAERIQLQLQNVESHIQTDVGKFKSFGKSKRKRLEMRFKEQQERLKLIHGKFKEEVNQHLEDCRSTLEELEAYKIELQGAAERQKASHRKLLLQVEEAIETQLGDAERRITAINKVAREKMLQLKNVITECSKEGVFS